MLARVVVEVGVVCKTLLGAEMERGGGVVMLLMLVYVVLPCECSCSVLVDYVA